MTPLDRPNDSTNVRLPIVQQLALRLGAVLAPRPTADKMIDAMLRTRRRAPSPEDARFLAEGLRRNLDVDGVQAATFRYGPHGGPRVGLLHGWNGSAADFRALAPALASAGASVVAIEAPGHGSSSGDRTNVAQMADTLARAAERDGGFDAVIAHSFGAAAATLAAVRGAAVGRLLLVAPAVDPGWYVRRVGRLAGRGFDAAIEAAMARRVGIHPRDVALTATLPRVPGPVAVITCRDDREVTFRAVVRAVGVRPDVRLWATDGLGHRRILRAPGVLDTAVGWVLHGDERSCPHGAVPTTCAACALEEELRDRSRRWAV